MEDFFNGVSFVVFGARWRCSRDFVSSVCVTAGDARVAAAGCRNAIVLNRRTTPDT